MHLHLTSRNSRQIAIQESKLCPELLLSLLSVSPLAIASAHAATKQTNTDTSVLWLAAAVGTVVGLANILSQ